MDPTDLLALYSVMICEMLLLAFAHCFVGLRESGLHKYQRGRGNVRCLYQAFLRPFFF
jgi:hypothetical protein